MAKPKGFLNKGISVLLLIIAVVLAVSMVGLRVLSNTFITILGFGAVILVHEFGHFIVAKVSDIKVEAFSIFFPPVLLGILKTEKGYRIRILPDLFKNEGQGDGEGGLCFTIGKGGKAGETEYRIGLIPFGGFVKMLGQDDIGAVKVNDDPRSFANKSAVCRMRVIAAGVIFNIISSVIIFMSVFHVGIKMTPAVVGGVVPGSSAEVAGIRAGDEVIEVNGKSKDLDFMNIAVAAALSDVNEAVKLKVRHADETVESFAIVAEKLPGSDLRLFGIMSPFSLTIGEVTDVNALLEKTRLQPGDKIRSVNGIDIGSHWQLVDVVENSLSPKATMLVERTDESGEATLVESHVRLGFRPLEQMSGSEDKLAHIYSIVPRLKITDAKQSTGLEKGDIIVAVGDVENPTYKELRDVTTGYEGRELAIKVLRKDVVFEATVVPQRIKGSQRVIIGIGVALDTVHPVAAKTISAEGGPEALAIPRGALITTINGKKVTSFYNFLRQMERKADKRVRINYKLGDETGRVNLDLAAVTKPVTVKSSFAEYIPFEGLEKVYKASGPIDAVLMGYGKTSMFVAQTYLTLKRLVGGLVSPKELMGPVGIISLSYQIVAERPRIYYAYLLGLISACIAVVNFLPLPPLDGGLIVLLLVEKIKGSALSERVQGIIAYTGWALIGAFFLYITWNDIVKFFL